MSKIKIYVLTFMLGVVLSVVGLAGARTLDMGASPDNFNNWQALNNVLGTLIDDGVALSATAAELNRNNDLTGNVVTLTGDTTIALVTHGGKTILLAEVGGNAKLTAILPPATGSGATYRFVVGVANTVEYEMQVTGTDVFEGGVLVVDGDLLTTINAVYAHTANGSDTLNYDSDTICGDIGDWAEFTDILSGVWSVRGECRSAGAAYTTPWAAEVS